MEREYKEIKLSQEEIRLVGVAIANQIICNNQSIEKKISVEQMEERNNIYKKILTVIEYLER